MTLWHQRTGSFRVAPGDRAFWEQLWTTPALRTQLLDPQGAYHWMIQAALKQPWWMIEPMEGYERRHFSAWFGNAFVQRHYDNPVITDLFYLHDLLHALTLPGRTFASPEQWQQHMRANEIAVSLETEILVYWRCPGLREQSFDFRIWHDALTTEGLATLAGRLDTYRHELADAPAELALRSAVGAWPLAHPAQAVVDATTLWDLRRAVTRAPDPTDAVERSLAVYEAQAEPFYAAWRPHWEAVEAERLAFAQACQSGPWEAAVAARETHWGRVADVAGVPYGTIARDLTAVGF